MRVTALLPVLLLAAGCTAHADPGGTTARVPMCGAVVNRGHPVVRADLLHGCTRTDGTLLQIPWTRCPQSTVLAHLRFESGDFWGYLGSTWHHVSNLDDSVQYQAAARSCG